MVLIKFNPKEIKTQEGTGKIIFSRYNIEKLEEFPKGPLIELIQGDIFLAPSPSTLHQEISANLNYAIRKYLKSYTMEGQPGKLYYAPVDVILSNENIIIPDLVYIKKSNESIIKEKAIEGVPDLMVEILSINRDHDLIYKKDLYETYGVLEYWIVDPTDESLKLFSYNKNSNKYNAAKEYKNSDIIKSEILLGFSLKVEDIFPK